MHTLILITVFAVPALLCAAITPYIIRTAAHHRLTDRVGQDHLTTRPLPRLGGIAIFLAFQVGLGLTYVLPVDRTFDPNETSRLAVLSISATIIFLVMLADDIASLTPRTKLTWQIAVALIATLPAIWGERLGLIISDFRLPLLGTITLPMWIAIPFTTFWIVGMINTINMVDGLDGLAAGVTLIACAILFIHTYFQPDDSRQFTISLLPLLMAGCIAGYLPYNWHPAKIIMGDCGAMFIGFTMAAISIIGGAKLATAMLALIVPIVDVAWLIVARLALGRSPLNRDTIHLHHRLYELGLSHRQVVITYYGLCLIFGALAVLLDDTLAKLAALVGAGLLLGLLLLLLARRQTHPTNPRPPGQTAGPNRIP